MYLHKCPLGSNRRNQTSNDNAFTMKLIQPCPTERIICIDLQLG